MRRHKQNADESRSYSGNKSQPKNISDRVSKILCIDLRHGVSL